MGANNWRACPKCEKIRAKEIEKQAEALAQAYGKLPVDEFLKLKKETESFKMKEPQQTLREDYELGTELDGELYVYYRCSCSVCGFNHNFEHKEVIA